MRQLVGCAATISILTGLYFMDFRDTPLERAFQLARTGEFSGVGAVVDRLRVEGFSVTQIEGPLLKRQIRDLCAASRTAKDK